MQRQESPLPSLGYRVASLGLQLSPADGENKHLSYILFLERSLAALPSRHSTLPDSPIVSLAFSCAGDSVSPPVKKVDDTSYLAALVKVATEASAWYPHVGDFIGLLCGTDLPRESLASMNSLTGIFQTFEVVMSHPTSPRFVTTGAEAFWTRPDVCQKLNGLVSETVACNQVAMQANLVLAGIVMRAGAADNIDKESEVRSSAF